jgi:hypothetical protein
LVFIQCVYGFLYFSFAFSNSLFLLSWNFLSVSFTFWGPSLFLHLTWSGDSLCQQEVWRGQSYAFSQWLCLQSCLRRLSKISL